MKKIKYLFTVILFTYACSQSKVNRSLVIHDHPDIKTEQFSTFIDKFKEDSLFQGLRIDNPLIIEVIDDDSQEVKFNKSLKEVGYVAFLQKDWEKTISITNSKRTEDTVVVELQCIDTGIVIDHFFVLRNGQWFLYKIRDLSD